MKANTVREMLGFSKKRKILTVSSRSVKFEKRG